MLSFVTRQALREEAPLVLGDVLAALPGVDSNKDSPWEQRPSIRGLTGQRVLVLGVRHFTDRRYRQALGAIVEPG